MTRFRTHVILLLAALTDGSRVSRAAATSMSGGDVVGSEPTSSSSSSHLTFFDQEYGHPRMADDAHHNNNNPNNTNNHSPSVHDNGQGKKKHKLPKQQQFKTSPSPTTYPPSDSPTPPTLHSLHGTALPRNCARQFAKAEKEEQQQPHANDDGEDGATKNERYSRTCRTWLAKNPQFVMPSVSPTLSPSRMPTPWFNVTSFVSEETEISDGSDSDSAISAWNQTDLANLSHGTNETNETNEGTASSTTASTTASITTTITTTRTTVTYRISPMDDTFFELYRPTEALGKKDKLKIDATVLTNEKDGNDNGSPTKFIQLKFGTGKASKEVDELARITSDSTTDATSELVGAKLQLYGLSDTVFGGYVSRVPSAEWNEETTTWSDYVTKGISPRDLLPNANETWSAFGSVRKDEWVEADLTSRLEGVSLESGNDGSGGSSSVSSSSIGGTSDNGEASNDDVLTLRITTDSSDGVIYASKEHPSRNGPVLELTFVVTATTSGSSNNSNNSSSSDVSLELNNETETEEVAEGVTVTTFGFSSMGNHSTSDDDVSSIANSTAVVDNLDTLIPVTKSPTTSTSSADTTASPSKSPSAAAMIHNNAKEHSTSSDVDETATDEEMARTTSIVSSSFRMIITAKQITGPWRRLLRTSHANDAGYDHGRDNGRWLDANGDYALYPPSIDEKERPAIMRHLANVYEKVLSISPREVLLVFEDDLVVEEVGSFSDGGIVRKSIFRVMAIFDDPAVSNIQSEDAADVLDQATLYAFTKAEEKRAFLEVLEGTNENELIVVGPAEYDVTVSKVDFSSGGNPGGDSAAAAVNNNSPGGEASNSNLSSPSSTSSSASMSWLPPTLVASASVLVFASSVVGFLLWSQRRNNNDSNDTSTDNILPLYKRKPGHGTDGNSPRSVANTLPNTPSPNVFMDRFKNKKTKFDYAEFEDDDVNDDSDSPSYASFEHSESITSARRALGASPDGSSSDRLLVSSATPSTPQGAVSRPAKDIRFLKNFHLSNHNDGASFDDSSVSDVSAHILGVRGTLTKKANEDDDADATSGDPDASQAESFLLDTTMESSYNMEAMSALDEVRLENVLQVEDGNGGLLSLSSIPSYPHDGNSEYEDGSTLSVAYTGHLFTTIDMLRTRGSSLLEMPPPPSDAASDSSASQHQDDDDNDLGEDDYKIDQEHFGEIGNEPEREKNERDAVSQSISDELAKVMTLLNSGPKSNEQITLQDRNITTERDEIEGLQQTHDPAYVYIGNVREPALADTVFPPSTPTATSAESGNNILSDEEERLSVPLNPTKTVEHAYDGVNVLMDDDESMDAELDDESSSGDPLQRMNNTLSDCMDILEKARVNSPLKKSLSLYGEINNFGDATPVKMDGASASEIFEDDESTFVTEKRDC